MPIIHPIRSPRGCLSYVLIDGGDAAIVDPSEEVAAGEYSTFIDHPQVRLRYVIETHTHADHISSAASLAHDAGALVVRHKAAPSPNKDIAVSGGESLPFGDTSLTILATPGHTSDSISVLTASAVFTGDALLAGGTGRTDLQGGDAQALFASLHEVLARLPRETLVYPAHSYQDKISSTIGQEFDNNPRLLLARDIFVETMAGHRPPLPELFEQAIDQNSR